MRTNPGTPAPVGALGSRMGGCQEETGSLLNQGAVGFGERDMGPASRTEAAAGAKPRDRCVWAAALVRSSPAVQHRGCPDVADLHARRSLCTVSVNPQVP